MAPGVLESFRQSGSGAIRGNAPCPCRNSARAALRSSAAQRVPEMLQKEAAREVGLGRPNSGLDIRKKLVSYILSPGQVRRAATCPQTLLPPCSKSKPSNIRCPKARGEDEE